MAFTWTQERIRWYLDASERTDFHTRLADYIRPYVRPEDHMCDLGCGLGRVSLILAKEVARVTCVDTDPRVLAVVERDAARLGMGNLVTCACEAARASSGDGSTGRGPTVTAPGQGDPRDGLPGPGNKGLRCYAYPRDPWVPSAPAEPGGRGGFFSLQLSPGNVPGNSNRAAGEAGGDRGWGISLPLAKSTPHYAAGGTRSPKWPYAGKALALS